MALLRTQNVYFEAKRNKQQQQKRKKKNTVTKLKTKLREKKIVPFRFVEK